MYPERDVMRITPCWLSEQILRDCGIQCGVDPSTDIEVMKARVEKEGLSFLTITLPAIGKGFLQALDSGRLTKDLMPQVRFKGGLPGFTRVFLARIFHDDGRLRDDACPNCIRCMRQFYAHASKILMPCSKEREQKAEDAYVACEHELGQHCFDSDLLSDFGKVSDIVMADLLKGVPYGDPYDLLVPRHGPGATQERILGNSKYRFRKWHSRLEEVFPFTEFGVASLRSLGEEECPLSQVEFVEPEREAPVRVIFVPKTLKTPRVIAIEPVCMQYMQQALLQFLVPRIEAGRYTRGRVNFSDQRVNQKLALTSSKDQRLSTMDLSEASDRVSAELVWRMLQVTPVLRDMVWACRSTRAKLPSGKILPLVKFASMGSALCFPMEALVFFIAIVTIRARKAKMPICSRTIAKMARDIYVYGDDIIVPADETSVISDDLSLFGLKVNRSKTFYTGKFRESCGMDAYDGVDITPVYCRRPYPADQRSAEEITSWVSMANQFYRKGWYHVACEIRDSIDSMMPHPLPHKEETSEGLGWVSYSKDATIRRYNRSMFRWEVKTWVPTMPKRSDPLSGDGALLKCLKLVGLDSISPKHLAESVKRGTLTLKYRWVPV